MSQPPINPVEERVDLVDDLRAAGLDVMACYQCGRCSAGCPVSPYMDLLSMEVIRLAGYGAEDTLLSSKSIWLCAACESCTTRCPNEIDIAGVMDFLRERALEQKRRSAQRQVVAFHRSFLRSVRRWGRTFEVGMLGAYKMRSGDLFGDLKLGWKMFRKGKLRLWPSGIRGRREVRRLFKQKRKKGDGQ